MKIRTEPRLAYIELQAFSEDDVRELKSLNALKPECSLSVHRVTVTEKFPVIATLRIPMQVTDAKQQ